MNRRLFLESAAAASLVAAYPAFAQRPTRRVGLIGAGWYGKVDVLRLIQVAPVEVVALADVDSQMAAGAADIISKRQKSGKKPRVYGDYRELLNQEEMDIVLIGTPDHWHALPMIEACKKGLDIYVQKPISVDVMEGQAMLAAARKYDRVVQVGTQRRSTPHLIDAKRRVVEEGMLGDIGHIEICCYYHMRSTANPPDEPPPSYLDYDMWTGPAPMRPYNPLVHPRRWRLFMEYCNGILGDMCIHMLDMVRWMLDLGWPTRISSTGGIYVQTEAKANTTDTQIATFEYPHFPIVWTHRTYGPAPDPDYPWAAILYGSKGTLKASVNSFDFIPNDENGHPLHQDVVYELDKYPEDRDEKDLERHVAPAVRGHMIDFLDAIDHRSKPVADIEQGYISTTSCILANLSLELGRTLEWDPEAGRVVGDEEANRLLARKYRSGWEHPEPAKV